jgi:hypothetical protein
MIVSSARTFKHGGTAAPTFDFAGRLAYKIARTLFPTLFSMKTVSLAF